MTMSPSRIGSPPVPSMTWPPTIAVTFAMSDLHRIETDVNERLACRHDRAWMNRQHDAGMRRLGFARRPAVQVEEMADHRSGIDAIAAHHRALEQSALGRVHPGEIREVPH